MLQVLDYFRRLYTQETNNPEAEFTPDSKTIFTPTWEYVCWLENRLSKYEKEPLPETETTTQGE